MSKKFLALAMAILLLFVTGCQPSNNGEGNFGEGDEANGRFVFKGVVTATDNEHHIEMDVIESDVASGIYWVLISEKTTFVDKNGNSISRASIKVGDTIAVTFSGQVMMSYPAQIAAQKITLL